jgi:hypothetical protein
VDSARPTSFDGATPGQRNFRFDFQTAACSSFRGDAKRRTRNPEIPGLVLTHHPGMTKNTHAGALAALKRPSCARPPPKKSRAQETPGASRTRSLACKSKKHASKSPQVGQTFRRFLRNGFNGLFRALPGEPGFVATIASAMRKHCRQLDASIGASGPHGFAVRFQVARLAHQKRPPHPAPNVRDDRDTPLL